MYSLNRLNIAWILTIPAQAYLLSMLILTAPALYAAEKEQIKIEQFSLNRSVAYFGEEISASVTVSAQPALRKKTLRLRYYLDQDEIGTQPITDFDPSGNAMSVFKFNNAPEGRFLFRIVLDIAGEKIIADEVSRQLAILSLPGGMTETPTQVEDGEQTPEVEQAPIKDNAPGMADLEPVAITFNIASPRMGEKIRITSRISNAGDVQADNAKIRIFINGQPYGDDITMNIAAGTTADIETDFLPASEGKKDILLLINPEGEVEEKSNRNNILSKTLIVRPAEKRVKPEKTAAVPRTDTSKKELANLVIYIETISGVHYTPDDKVQFYITNNSQTVATKPFKMGAQLLQGSPGKLWLMRKSVKGLKPGETITLSIRWPENQFSTSNLYVATVDLEGVIDETDVRDNHTRPFRVISTSSTRTAQTKDNQPPVITINRPRQDEQLTGNRKLVINWKSSGDSGKRVRITVHNSRTKGKILSSVTSNDGQHSIDLSQQAAGEYLLTINAENNTEILAKRNFRITGRESTQSQQLVSPVSGASYRGEQQVMITWPENLKKTPGLQLDLVLLESSSKKVVKLNSKPIKATTNQFSWQVPDDGSVFGIYSLQARTLDGRLLAKTDQIELLPNFVSFDQPETNRDKEDIKTDLEIVRTNFNGKDLEFLVMNNGPAEISAAALLGYKFTSYFVRKVPIASAEDLVICKSSLLAELPQGEGQVISLGRNPDCPLGEREYGARFEYVVNRFTLPKLVSQRVIDPKLFNNLSKYYWTN